MITESKVNGRRKMKSGSKKGKSYGELKEKDDGKPPDAKARRQKEKKPEETGRRQKKDVYAKKPERFSAAYMRDAP